MPAATAAPQVPVLIFGSHITALGVLRALVARGIPSYVVDDTSDIIVHSRWYRAAERTLAETDDSAALAAYLSSLTLPRAVLIACSDRWMSAVAGLPSELCDRFPASVPPRAAVETFVDKERFRTLIDRLGIPHPRTLPLRNPADLDLATDVDLEDGFLKPTDSQRYYLRFGTKGSFVTSREEAARLVADAAEAGLTFMLQEWIPGDMSATILIDGFVDRVGVIKAMVARRRVRMDPPRIANTASDVTIPLADVREATDALKRLLPAVGYRGIFNVEFKFDARDGHFKIIELNPRPFWLIGHIAKAGADLPWMTYLDAQELPIPDVPPYQIGRHGLYEIPDGAALVRAWSSLRRPEGSVIDLWLRGDHTLFWLEDPMPGAHDIWHSLRRRLVGIFGGAPQSQPSAQPSHSAEPTGPI
jgi:predicted ATP-grasp superfamily ATP-dependent carboligase